jgi:hypothetical protein
MESKVYSKCDYAERGLSEGKLGTRKAAFDGEDDYDSRMALLYGIGGEADTKSCGTSAASDESEEEIFADFVHTKVRDN